MFLLNLLLHQLKLPSNFNPNIIHDMRILELLCGDPKDKITIAKQLTNIMTFLWLNLLSLNLREKSCKFNAERKLKATNN